MTHLYIIHRIIIQYVLLYHNIIYCVHPCMVGVAQN